MKLEKERLRKGEGSIQRRGKRLRKREEDLGGRVTLRKREHGKDLEREGGQKTTRMKKEKKTSSLFIKKQNRYERKR